MFVDLSKAGTGDIAVFLNGEVRQIEEYEDRTGRTVSHHLCPYFMKFTGLWSSFYINGRSYSQDKQCELDIVEIIKNPSRRPMADIIREALK